MSHQPERTEKNCLNCGTEVAGRYCQQCGQENIVPHQNFRHLVQHFIFDLFHFDGKFFETLKYLLLRPGRVPREYIAGRRQSYLDPIRMYLFTSAFFFLVFAGMNRIKVGEGALTDTYLSRAERYEVASELSVRKADSNAIRALPVLLDTSLAVYLRIDSAGTRDSAFELRGKRYYYKTEPKDHLRASNFDVDLGNGWLGRALRKRVAHFNERFDEDRREAKAAFIEGLFHRLPYMLFVSLPFFALLLKLLYMRRKQFFYADHLVFTLYHYIFNFILLLAVFLIARLNTGGWAIGSWIIVALLLYSLWSLYKGMRNFYGQSRGRTLGKFLLLNVMAFFVVSLLLLIFVLISAIQL
ncbi:DUF3667 domain-containing protein [Flaviaesturariibacter aridisoli]|uniref:DUF3667 domain-containing protein n=1 Tax=Flaviaesturariibacter aridisoli TaxID=2545761 RepID=UPI0014055835|nr:DUF3667 domain-containing protein [Flaviaesturariibacter aridisoli]